MRDKYYKSNGDSNQDIKLNSFICLCVFNLMEPSVIQSNSVEFQVGAEQIGR